MMDRKVVGVVFFGVVAMVAVVTSPQLLDVVSCSAVVAVVGPRLIDGCGVFGGFGGFWGGLITFLAARLSRYSLGLAAMLCTLLLQRTLPHAINFFL